MDLVAVFIAAHAQNIVCDSILETARRVLEDVGAKIDAVNWLAPDEAVEVFFKNADQGLTQSSLKTAFAKTPIDIAVLPAAGREKKLLLADMDSTMIAVECIDELADFVGLKDQVSAITEAAMQGQIDFKDALEKRVALLKDMDFSVLETCFHERIRANPGAKTLITTMRERGAYCALVSGGFTFFTERVAQSLGFHFHRANILGVVSNHLTGKVVPPIVNANAKEETLFELSKARGVHKSNIITVGDGANDIPMMQASGLSVAYHAKPKAREAADVAIDHSDLRALLYLQGISKSEFCD